VLLVPPLVPVLAVRAFAPCRAIWEMARSVTASRAWPGQAFQAWMIEVP
jgi:hypothetical protein